MTHSAGIIRQPRAADVTGAKPTRQRPSGTLHYFCPPPYFITCEKKTLIKSSVAGGHVAAPRPRRNMKMATDVSTQYASLRAGPKGRRDERGGGTQQHTIKQCEKAPREDNETQTGTAEAGLGDPATA